jgi:pimeloyl-ACP methyl ester carboxylesterase
MRAYAYGLLGKDTYERLPQERKQQARENLSTLRAQALGAGFPSLSDNDVRAVKVPTLLMTGERSPAYLLRLTDRLQQLLPNAERVEIAGASHLMSEGEGRRDQRRDPRLPRQRCRENTALGSAGLPDAEIRVASISETR